MSAVDWSKLTPAEVWTSLKSAPRIAGPWHQSTAVDQHGYPDDHRPRRSTPCGVSVVWELAPTRIVVPRDSLGPEYTESIRCSSREETDEVLRACGWLLADADQ